MAFKNLMMTSSGMVLYAKAQQGKHLRFSRIAVGDGLLGNGESMVNRSALKSERASFLIDHVQVSTSSAAAEILTTMRNDDMTEGFYFRELGICAIDPDTQEEQLCFYDNAGEDGEYIPAASENVQVVERLKMLIKLENTPNISFVASGNPIYLTEDDIDDDAQGPGVLWSSQKIALSKQDKLTGTAGQVVGFNAEGEAEARSAVLSFKGRTGAVTPQSGDYTATQVGARANTWLPTPVQIGAAPTSSPVFTGSISLGRKDGTEIGPFSSAVGYNVTADTYRAHAEGSSTTASGTNAHAEGNSTTASGMNAHAEGNSTTASGYGSHAQGEYSIAQGNSACASGFRTIANSYQFVVGGYNVESTDADQSSGDRFIVGGGNSLARKNAFRVHSSGACYGSGAWNSSGADYAELFEWLDSNPDAEDRAGLFVTLEGDRLRLAGPEDDFILGIVSADPSVVGDVYDDQWAGMYLRDVFGRTIMEMQDFPAETTQVPREDGTMETVELIPACRELAPVVNPEYDHTIKYLPRTQRPEWDAVGMMGRLVAVDGGTCQVNGWCAVGEGGKGTHSDTRTRCRVMARLDETHIRVLIL